MFLLLKPSSEVIHRFIASQKELAFTYSQTGATRELQSPQGADLRGFTIDHNRIRLGEGKETYERAVAALRVWRQFDLGWIKIVTGDQPISVGTTVAVQARTFGVWSLSAARIVYVVDEDRPLKRFGFAYGTLPDHVECGEELFTVAWQADDSVWYDILAFSRPRHPLARAAFPLTRMLQKRFARESLAVISAGCLFPSPQTGRG